MKRYSYLIIICTITSFLMSCAEQPTIFYPRYEDAVKDGAVKRGWVPGYVPESASEIHEQHNIDTNDQWVRFKIQESDKAQLIYGLQKIPDDKAIQLEVRKPSRANWWFECLVQQCPANDNALNADIYGIKCHDGKIGYIAFDRTIDTVYYWCTE